MQCFGISRAGLAFVHGRGIAHCDLKPPEAHQSKSQGASTLNVSFCSVPPELHLRQNLLLDGKSQTLKICDFGTAKRMVFGEQRLPFFTVPLVGCRFPCRAECVQLRPSEFKGESLYGLSILPCSRADSGSRGLEVV